MTFAEWLTMTGRAMGYVSNSDLARALGIQQSNISRWKSGSRPGVDHLLKISELFGVNLKALLVLTGYVEPGSDDPDSMELAPKLPEGRVAVSQDDLRSVLSPAAGQDITVITSAMLRLREAAGLDEPSESTEVRHGLNGYRRGCRCDECREANRVHCRLDRAQRVARGKADPSLIPHGIGGYQNWGCRCKTCAWAGSIKNRATSAKRTADRVAKRGEDR